jgi:hypothetical protein
VAADEAGVLGDVLLAADVIPGGAIECIGFSVWELEIFAGAKSLPARPVR